MGNLMNPSCRVALAAMLHDLGKFAERAGVFAGSPQVDSNVQLYCPKRQQGGREWHTHKHAAHTGLAIDRIEPLLPRIKGADVSPFAAWGAADADDSLINAAAAHHVPRSALQWIVATADRAASGFERITFDDYNRAPDDGADRPLDYITIRQHTAFEGIDPSGGSQGPMVAEWRYPLKPLSPGALFPVRAKDYELPDRERARAEYRELWEAFEDGLAKIPHSHRVNLALWLDHFDTLYACHGQAIPSATAFGAVPDVSLYDHSRATAALAVALWRYHYERGDAAGDIATALRVGTEDSTPKILLVQGDLFGIQDFIFAAGGETQRRAAKLLRGRSFYVSLLTECGALSVLDALDLPSTSQVINAAGKFRIVAPNTETAKTRLAEVRRRVDQWFLEHTYGQAGLGLVWSEASVDDFRRGSGESSPYQALIRRLFEQLEEAKLRRFELCARGAASPVFHGYLDAVGEFVCAVDGRSPAECEIDGVRVSKLAADHIEVGAHLARGGRLLVSRRPLGSITLRVPVFGWHVSRTGDEEQTGRFGAEASSGNLVRAWDFDLPQSPDEPLWAGYGRRAVNAYVPKWHEPPNQWERKKYPDRLLEEDPPERGKPKTLNHLACSGRYLDDKGRPVGIEAIAALKGDVDNLGLLFQQGLHNPSFAREAGFSRQLNAFFAIWLPAVCASEPDFQDCYTVFAGGDDFFLVGPWKKQIELARRMRSDFARYVAANPRITFSTGLSVTKPGLPIRQLAHAAEGALDEAKKRQLGGRLVKDGVRLFDRTVGWNILEQLLSVSASLDGWREEYGLSTGFVYDLLRYVDMAENLAGANARLEDALWRSHFFYRTYRMLEKNRNLDRDARKRCLDELADKLGDQGIHAYKGDFRIALYTHLYQHRD
jgi:CRISPR-associated protein Csm1